MTDAIDRRKSYRLARDVTVKFHNYEVKAPKGAPLWLIKFASGTTGDLLAIPPRCCDAGAAGAYNKHSIFKHDCTYYYIWAPEGSWEEAC